ncbi:MAG: sulfatase-like hydrolase/transferase, partial [Candidatus Dormibacteraeota bacterium]|nr:sulfatase-like hydrolase/transferase [Candidatus Dormibacteraeota bacterium]
AELIDAQGSRYLAGWDRLREQRISRQRELGLIGPEWTPSERDPRVAPWDGCAEKEWEARRMAVYAAQVARMDHGIGRIVGALERTGQLNNTLLVFLSDNGGCAEGQPYGLIADLEWVRPSLRATTRDGRLVLRGNRPDLAPGDEATFSSYGIAWANVSNAPFREYKHWVHEGGIATPFVVHWPAGGLPAGQVQHQPFQLPDVMATILDATGVAYPAEYEGRTPIQPSGRSMLTAWRGDDIPTHDLFWEHEGNAAVRRGPWKLVRKFPGAWELYNLDVDRAELTDRSHENIDLVRELAAAWERWAAEWGVIPRERIVDCWEQRGKRIPPDAGVSSLVTDWPNGR